MRTKFATLAPNVGLLRHQLLPVSSFQRTGTSLPILLRRSVFGKVLAPTNRAAVSKSSASHRSVNRYPLCRCQRAALRSPILEASSETTPNEDFRTSQQEALPHAVLRPIATTGLNQVMILHCFVMICIVLCCNRLIASRVHRRLIAHRIIVSTMASPTRNQSLSTYSSPTTAVRAAMIRRARCGRASRRAVRQGHRNLQHINHRLDRHLSRSMTCGWPPRAI